MSETQVQENEKPQFYITEEHHPEHSTMLGFWLYLMSDCLIFAVLFATHGVVGRNYAAGPSPADLFDLSLVALLQLFRDEAHSSADSRTDRGAFAATGNRANQCSATGASTNELHVAVRSLLR